LDGMKHFPESFRRIKWRRPGGLTKGVE